LQRYRRIGLRLVGQRLFRDFIRRRLSSWFRKGSSRRKHWELNVIERMLRFFGTSFRQCSNEREISEKYELFRDVVQNLAVLDCLLSLSAVASLPGYSKPEFVDTGGIEVVAARHPMVEQILSDAFVPNDIQLRHDEMRSLILTGPNMVAVTLKITNFRVAKVVTFVLSH
jgi:hypothetical protein